MNMATPLRTPPRNKPNCQHFRASGYMHLAHYVMHNITLAANLGQAMQQFIQLDMLVLAIAFAWPRDTNTHSIVSSKYHILVNWSN